MADPIIFKQQPGGVPVQDVLGVIPFEAIQQAVPLDNTSNAIKAPIAFNAPSPGEPVLQPSLIDFLKTITDAIQAHKETNQKNTDAEVDISAKAYANFITGADAIMAQIDALVAEAKAQSAAVQKIQDDVATAYTAFSTAVNAYNTGIASILGNDLNATNTVNANITFLNSFQGLSTSAYNTQIAANGGEAATLATINTGFTNWNTYVGTRNPQVAVLQANMDAAITTWKNAINSANTQITAINNKRASKNLPPVSLYPDPTTTYTTSYPAPLTAIPTISGAVGPNRALMATVPGQAAGQVTVVSLSSLALSTVPKLTDLTNSDVYKALVALFTTISTNADLLAIALQAIFANISDPSLKQKNKLLPASYIDKVDPIYLNSEGSGNSLGQVGRPEFDRVVPVTLWKSIFDKAKFPASSRLISAFQLAALGILDKSALAAAIPAASAFGNKLGSISALSPTFAAVLASAIADNTLATTAANPARELANILLKNVIGAASAAGITFGDLGAPSAGELAQISGSLSAAFNVDLLGTTLAMFQQTLGYPDLALQVVGNADGLSPSDAIRASIGGAKFSDVLSDPLAVVFLKQSLADAIVLQSGYSSESAAVIANNTVNGMGTDYASEDALQKGIEDQLVQQGLSQLDASLLASEFTQYVNAEIGVPALNQPPPDVIKAIKAASNLLDSVLGLNAAQENVMDKIVQQFKLDREKIASIIKESIQAAIRGGKLDISRELRNETVAALRSGGYGLKESLYLSNQLINQMTGNPLSPVTGITADRLEQLKEADKGISQASINEALNSGPFSSELAFTNTLRGIVERSGGGIALDKALAGISNIKIMNIEELHKSLSQHLDNLLTGLGAANAREARDKILIALLGGATPKEVVDVDKRNPVSIINQISEQKARISQDARKEDEEKIHERFLEVMQAFMTPNAVLGNAITSMQDKPTTVLNSISGAVQAVAQTDILQGPV